MQTVHGDGPGKPKWREELRSSIRELYCDIANEYIELGAGAPALLGQADIAKKVRAMIIEAGGGSAVGRTPITAGPPGRSVWDEDIAGKHPSQVKSSYSLPEAFNQEGNHFIENAMDRLGVFLVETLDAAAEDIPSSIFCDNIFVQGSV